MILKEKFAVFLNDPAAKQLLGKGFIALSVKVASAGFSFFMFVLLANALTPEEYGRFAIGFSLAITLSVFAGLGLGTAVLRYLPQYKTENDIRREYGFMRMSAILTLVTPIILGVLFSVGLVIYIKFHGEVASNYLFASTLLTFFMTLAEFAACLLRANGFTLLSMAPRDIVWRIVGCAFAFYFVLYGLKSSATYALLALSASLCAITVWQLWLARTDIVPSIFSKIAVYDFSKWKKVVWPMWGAAALYALAQQFDIVIVGYFLSPVESGPYFAALRTANMLSLVLIAGNLISAPIISKLHFSGDKTGLQRTMRLLSLAIALPTVLGFVILIFAGSALLHLFNPAFVSAYALLIILAIGFTFDAVAGPTGYMLQMIGEEKAYLKIMGFSYFVTIVLQFSLATTFGAYGVAIPNALGLIIANCLIVYKVRKTLGIDPSIIGLFLKVRS